MADSERSKTGGDEAGKPAKQREELDQLLQRIAAHIAEVDKSVDARTGALDEHGGGAAEPMGQGEDVVEPTDLQSPVVTGDDSLGDKVNEMVDAGATRRNPSTVEPPALRSALGGHQSRPVSHHEGAEARNGQPNISEGHVGAEAHETQSEPGGQRHDQADRGEPRHADEPWDTDTAEALTRTYEADAALPPLRSMLNLMAKSGSSSTQHESERNLRLASMARGEISTADIDAAQTRLFEAARRVETMLDRLAPKDAIDALGDRFQTLEGEVRRSAVQLQRLDGIEHRLGELGQKLSDEQVVSLFGSLVPTADELTQFAEDAAGRAAERVLEAYARDVAPSLATQSSSDTASLQAVPNQLMSLGSILGTFMDERRRTDASTLESLETLQLAMQHVLDRIERVDGGMDPAKTAPPHNIGSARRDLSPDLARQEIAFSLGEHSDHHYDAEDDAHSGLGNGSEGMVNLTANQGASDLTADSYSMPDVRMHELDRLRDAQGLDEALPVPQHRIDAMPRGRSENEGGAPIRASEIPGHDATEVMHAEAADAGELHPANDRQAVIAMARKAAERANAQASSAGIKGRIAKAAKGGFLSSPASSGIIRPGVVLVAIAAILFAGYWFLIGQKHGLLNPFASVAVEQPLPEIASPANGAVQPDEHAGTAASANSAEPADEAAARPNPNETRNEPSSTPSTIDRQDANAAPAASDTSGPGMAIAFGNSPATFDEVMKARERSRLANLSQRAAFSAARANSVVEMPAPRSANAQPHAGSRDTSSISTSSVARDEGSAPNASAMTNGREGQQHLSLPPATTGPLSLRLAAAQGDAAAQLEVATRLAEGKGVRQDFAEAARWYERSANQGQAIAQYRLATLYERGMGVKPDRVKAKALYEKSAEQGNLKAMHNLAVVSASSTAGSPDYATAARLFTRAAEHGLHDSQYNLGVLYESGLGVPKDHAAAYKWYSLAARGGDKGAARRRDMLISRLPSETLQAMDAQISAWQATPAEEIANNVRLAGSSWMQSKSQPAQR
ncbi:MAG: hypothetical protein AB7E81_11955 [Hyphomicrobiaceae bacterium]